MVTSYFVGQFVGQFVEHNGRACLCHSRLRTNNFIYVNLNTKVYVVDFETGAGKHEYDKMQ